MHTHRSTLPGALCACALIALGLLCGTAGAEDATRDTLDPLDPLRQPARSGAQVDASVLIGAARAGSRLVVVGEGGRVLLSDDDGNSWRQARVPVSVTLTAVRFIDECNGWVVGHSGVLLRTRDGGENWTRVLDGFDLVDLPVADGDALHEDALVPPEPGDPLLDVLFIDPQRGFAVGAFGLVLATRDGGRSWVHWHRRVPNPDGNHLYGLHVVEERLYVVGERGTIFASDDGNTFIALEAPYEGSFFGVTGRDDGPVIIYGLQGHVHASDDGGTSWRQIAGNGRSAWTGATVLSDQRVVLVGQGGDVLLEDRSGRFVTLPQQHVPLSAVIGLSAEGLLAVGPRGAQRIRVEADLREANQ